MVEAKVNATYQNIQGCPEGLHDAGDDTDGQGGDEACLQPFQVQALEACGS